MKPVRTTLATVATAVLAITGVAYAQHGQRTEAHLVTRTIDGDTIEIRNENGSNQRVRILAIDTPEKGQCGAQEATDRTRQLAENRVVTLSADPNQPGEDRYGRLLRFVELLDGQDLGETLLTEGRAEVYEQYPTDRTPDYRQVQQQAKDDLIGIWNTCRSPSR